MGKFPFLGSTTNQVIELLHLLSTKIDAMMDTIGIIDELKQMTYRLEVKNQSLHDEVLKLRGELNRLTEENRKVINLSGLCEVDYMTIKEAALYSRYKETTLRKYVEEGRIDQGPKGKGRRIMIQKASLDEFIGRRNKDRSDDQSDDSSDNNDNPDDLCTTAESL